MTRTVDLGNRAALLERVSGYVLNHGLADLSLRPLAKAVGSSPRALLYHFGSKEAIVTEVLARVRERQRAAFDHMRRSDISTPAAVCRSAWTYMTAPRFLPMMRLFFETYALALRDPKRFPGFFEGAVEDWLRFLSDPICKGDVDPRRARTIATVMLAGFRGFMLDFAATQDSDRIEAAVDFFADSLAAVDEREERNHAEQA